MKITVKIGAYKKKAFSVIHNNKGLTVLNLFGTGVIIERRH